MADIDMYSCVLSLCMLLQSLARKWGLSVFCSLLCVTDKKKSGKAEEMKEASKAEEKKEAASKDDKPEKKKATPVSGHFGEYMYPWFVQVKENWKSQGKSENVFQSLESQGI